MPDWGARALQAMHIDFQTKSGRLRPTKQPYLSYWEKDENPVQRRGFRAQFEISDRFMAISKYHTYVVSMLAHRLRRWDNIKTALGPRLVFAATKYGILPII